MRLPRNVDDGIEMKLSEVESTEKMLSFKYTVDNHSAHETYLINELFTFHDTDLYVDHNLVYAELSGSSTLHLRKQCIMIPKYLKVEAPEVPLATKLPAGDSFSETLHLALPIAPNDPYQPQAQAPTSSMAKRFVFSLGYVVTEQPFAVKQITLPSGAQYWRVQYDVLSHHQRLKVSKPIRADVSTTAMLK